MDCDFVAEGQTIEEVMAQAARHGKETHGYTDEQLQDPKMVERMKAVIKKV
jgi:predicted small metal-binding protein